jgi:hypothetical protein
MASLLATTLKARLDALEDQRDDLLDEMAFVALDWPFISSITTEKKLNEVMGKMLEVCAEITVIAREWRSAVSDDYPLGLWPYKEHLLEREWRKFRKFPRLKSILIELYNDLDNPITGV